MSRNDFLQELAQRLNMLPQFERDEALQYYNEYLEDAENEESAIESLGSPSRLAAQIAGEYSTRILEEKRTSVGLAATSAAAPPAVSDYASYTAPSQTYTSSAYTNALSGDSDVTPKTQSSFKWMWYILLGIFAIPVGIPLAVAVFVLIVTVLALCIAFVAVFVGIVISLIFGGFFMFFSGFGALTWGSSFVAVGVGLAALGVAILLIPLLIKFSVWLVRAIGQLFSKIFTNLKKRTDDITDEKQ